MAPPRTAACLAAFALAAPGAALAQQGPADFSADLRVVEQGVEDVSPLSVGRVDLSADLAVPLGFGKVYELPPGPDGQRRFARRSGAVWVVFTRADYIQTKEGLEAVAPPNALIYVGEPPGLRGTDEAAHSPLYTPLRVSTRQDLRAGLTPQGASQESAAGPGLTQAAPAVSQQQGEAVYNPTVLTSEAYRTERIRALLSAAATGG